MQEKLSRENMQKVSKNLIRAGPFFFKYFQVKLVFNLLFMSRCQAWSLLVGLLRDAESIIVIFCFSSCQLIKSKSLKNWYALACILQNELWCLGDTCPRFRALMHQSTAHELAGDLKGP